MQRLQNEIKQLRTTLERDKREGRPTLAARKEKYVKALEQAVSKDSNQNNKARLVVDMDYTVRGLAVVGNAVVVRGRAGRGSFQDQKQLGECIQGGER